MAKSGNEAKLQEEIRDLRAQLDDLSKQDLYEVLFQEINTGREPVTLYRSENGETITIPAYMVPKVINLRDADGRFRFVADKSDAPEFKPNTIKCFMHKDSPDRATLDAAGLAGKTCPAAHLASTYSMNIHAAHRHRYEWAAYQKHLSTESAAKEQEERRQQLEATLAIARAANPQAVPEAAPDCPDCDWKPKPDAKSPATALGMHRKAQHPAVGVA